VTAADFAPGQRVRYIPGHAHDDMTHPDCEDGIVSSVGSLYVFVRFHAQVARLGWDGSTAQACDPGMLARL
jgi:hypothetical protein